VLVLFAGCAGGGIIPTDETPDPGNNDPSAPVTASVTVNDGNGGGTFEVGSEITITADAAPDGSEFDGWTGDVDALDDPNASETTLTVPEGGATVTATYRDVEPPPSTPSDVITASVETDPVPGSGDAADDPCVWIHPTDPSQSTVIGTDKTGNALLVYDLDGNEIQQVDAQRVNNVDIRYNFPFDGGKVTLVTASNRSRDSIKAYRVDESTRQLVYLGDIDCGISVYGYCMYRSASSGEYYGFINSKSGEVEQWRLYDSGGGSIAGERVRTFDVGSIVEGCVADDELGYFYVSEETEGIWKYGAEPSAGSTRTSVDTVDGELSADIEGLTIYYASNGTGYLIASAQGPGDFVIYKREGSNDYVATFEIEGGVVDGVGGTDGIDVTNVNLGSAFPSGFFVAQDGGNNNGNQNFKLVPWERIALAFSPALTIDTGHDPR
jgi:3-phytase